MVPTGTERTFDVIRHPEIPRVVFELLWDTLKADQEMFAHINNLAKDGANYWVLAHVTPSHDASGNVIGYHSNRRVPDRDAIAAAENLYAARGRAAAPAPRRRHRGVDGAVRAPARRARADL